MRLVSNDGRLETAPTIPVPVTPTFKAGDAHIHDAFNYTGSGAFERLGQIRNRQMDPGYVSGITLARSLSDRLEQRSPRLRVVNGLEFSSLQKR